MSYEAVAWTRSGFLRGTRAEFEQKWLTVPTDDPAAARRAFEALGVEVKGLSVLDQARATELAARIGVAQSHASNV